MVRGWHSHQDAQMEGFGDLLVSLKSSAVLKGLPQFSELRAREPQRHDQRKKYFRSQENNKWRNQA